MLESYLQELRNYVASKSKLSRVTERSYDKNFFWPAGNGQNVVLKQDTAVEMGNPREESVSFVLWVNDPSLVHDGTITIVGPDIREKLGMSLSFGKVVVAGVKGFNEENSYNRYREMELLRYELDLKGYMMRAVLQNHREWSRISRDAMDRGFSFSLLGSALIKKFKEKDYIESVEVVFTISNKQDVQELRSVFNGAMIIVSAMDKMAEGLAYLCNTCDYKDVCDEVGELRDLHNSLAAKKIERKYMKW